MDCLLCPIANKMGDARITRVSPNKNEAHEACLETLDLTDVRTRERTLRLRPWWDWQGFAQAGWYFLGVADRVRCVSCKGLAQNSGEEENPLLRHLELYPWCDFAQKRKRELEIIMHAGNDPHKFNEVSQTIEFPLTSPITPSFANMVKRADSFDNTHLPCDAKDAARAGFFWLGIADRIKCYYCNGGLRRLSPFDNLFVEHAKWFPHCEHINRTLGVPLVRRIARYYDRDIGSHGTDATSSSVAV